MERVFKLLEDFGLSQEGAKVYIYMAKTRPQKTKELAVGLKMSEHKIQPVLNRLREKGVVTSNSERPIVFSALAFEDLLNLCIKVNMEHAQIIRESKEELLNAWRYITAKRDTQF